MIVQTQPVTRNNSAMKLQKLLDRLQQENQLLDCTIPNEDMEIIGLSADSRTVNDQYLFCAYPGHEHDGHDFIEEAVENGASTIVCEEPKNVPENQAVIQVKDARRCEAYIADEYYDHPASKMNLIGVTGTNGKTTTSYILHALLEQLGENAGLVGSIHHKFGDRTIPSTMTTPSPIKLHALLDQMNYHDCDWAVLEVSSHALDQYRVAGISFDAAIFTNLSRDHLDYHGSMEAYRNTKAQLFSGLSEDAIAVVNEDDEATKTIREVCDAPTVSYGTESQHADYHAKMYDQRLLGSSWFLTHDNTATRIRCRLTGQHNIENATAALATLHQLLQKTSPDLRDEYPEEISTDLIQKISSGLPKLQPIKGRLEPVKGPGKINVFVDYAHTPGALKNVLQNIQPLVPGTLRAVFGCGGDRDHGKRPEMGRAVENYADQLYITSDNPRSEDPEEIIEDILEGLNVQRQQEETEGQKQGTDAGLHAQRTGDQDRNRYVNIDRKQAIKEAIFDAEPGDVVLILGKGHESFQEINGSSKPFDDKEVAQNMLTERFAKQETPIQFGNDET